MHVTQRLRLVFAGTPEFAVPCLEAALASPHEVVAVYTQPDRPAGRGRALAASPVKQAALAAGLPVEQPESLRTVAARRTLAAYRPDLMIVVAYGLILPPKVLAMPRFGCWNVHASLLPKYRGAAPIQWAVLNGDATTGVTLMQMEAGLDTGPMMLKREVPIADDDTAGTMFEKLAPVGAALLLEGLDALSRGAIAPERQDDTQATLAPMLEKEQGRVDFAQPARRVRDWIRGMDPWPGAFTSLDGEVLKVWGPRLAEGEAGAAPGMVLGAGGGLLRVACGEGAVAIGEAQLPGRKRMPIASLVAGRPVPRGTILGGP